MKKAYLLLASALMVTTMVGCADTSIPTIPESNPTSEPGSGESSSTATLDPNDPHALTAEVTFWHSIGKEKQATLNSIITEFNKVYPNITITHTSQGGYDDVHDNIASAIPAGTTPVMAYCYPDHVADYLPSESVVKLDKYINSTEYGMGVDNGLGDLPASDFIEEFYDEGCHYTVAGEAISGVYSMPWSKSTEVLFYNKDAFDENGWEVPTTWDEMWELWATIKQTYPDSTPLGYDSDANMIITMFEQMGIPYTTGEGTDHFLFNNQDAKDLITDLKAKYDLGYWCSQQTLGAGTYTSTKFTAEEVFMSIGSTGGTTYNYTTNFETGVASIPQANLSNPKVIMQGPSVCFFSEATKVQKQAAWLFYKFATNTHNSAIWSVFSGYNPVRVSSFTDTAYLNRETGGSKNLVKDVANFLASEDCIYNLGAYYTSPAFKGSSAARSQMDKLSAAVMTGTKTVDEAFADAMAACLFAA